MTKVRGRFDFGYANKDDVKVPTHVGMAVSMEDCPHYEDDKTVSDYELFGYCYCQMLGKVDDDMPTRCSHMVEVKTHAADCGFICTCK